MEQLSLPDLPFSILVLAPFVPQGSDKAILETVSVNPLDIDLALAKFAPRLFIPLPDRICPEGGLHLQFKRLIDFTPDALLRNQHYLKNLLAADSYIKKAKQRNIKQQEIREGLKEWSDLPKISLAPEDTSEKGKTTVDNILSMVAVPDLNQSQDRARRTNELSYEAVANEILGIIFANPTFRSLESCWQGLSFLSRYLVKVGGRITLQPVLTDTLQTCIDEIKRPLSNNFFSLLLVDLPFTSSQRSVEMLDQLAKLGQEMLLPVLTWADAPFFQASNWQEIDRLPFLPHHLSTASFAKYRKLRQSDASRWLGLFCIRFLSRFPYGPENHCRTLSFNEKKQPWLSPIWAVAAMMSVSVERTGWPGLSDTRHFPLEDLPLLMEQPDDPCCLETRFTDNRLEQLTLCGIMSLSSWERTDKGFLAGEMMVSGDVSVSYQVLVCRVSHFLLACREQWQGTFKADELAERLKSGFLQFSEMKNNPSIGQLEIHCIEDKQQLMVHFRWLPSREILVSGQEIVLEFSW